MATVIMSHRTDGAPPPLPARDSIPKRHVQRNQSSLDTSQKVKNTPKRNHSTDTDVPPPVPPLNGRHKLTEPHGGAASNRGVEKNAEVDAVSHFPKRDFVTNKDEAPPIARKAFETTSFIDRHTARAFSSSGDVPPPAPPSTSTLPKRNSERQRRNDNDTPPELPPGRPLKSTTVRPTMDDLERRFTFHDVTDLPDPEPMTINKKNYPSVSQPVRRKQSSGQGAVNSLGYL